MIKNILLSILLLFKVIPVVAVDRPPFIFELHNIEDKIVAEDVIGSGSSKLNINHICDIKFDFGVKKTRTVKFVFKTTEAAKKYQLGLFLGDDTSTNYLDDKNIVETWSKDEGMSDGYQVTTFVVIFNKKIVEPKIFNINYKSDDGIGWMDTKRDLRVWDCRVPIIGGLYKTSDCTKDEFQSSYSLKYDGKAMDVQTDGTYSSNLETHLEWRNKYKADFGYYLNELIKPVEFELAKINTVNDPYMPVEPFKKDYCLDPWGFTTAGQPKMYLECNDGDEMLHLRVTYTISGMVMIKKIVVKIGEEIVLEKYMDKVETTFNFDWPVTESMDGQEVILILTNEDKFGGETREFNLGNIVWRSCKLMWFQVNDGGILSNNGIKNRVKPDENMCVGSTGVAVAPTIDVGRGGISEYYIGGEMIVSMKDWSKMLNKDFEGFEVTTTGEKIIDSNIYPRSDGKVNVIAAPSIRITKEVTEINAILIAYGDVESEITNSDITIETGGERKDSQLVVNGSLISRVGNIIIKRNMANNDAIRGNEQPSVKVNFMPEYLFKLPKELMEVLGDWRLGG